MTRIVTKNRDVVVIDLEREYVALSTAGCPQIYATTRYVVFKRVPKDFGFVDLDKYCIDVAKSVGLDRDKATIFLTAVDVDSYGHGVSSHGGVTAEAFATLGIETPSCVEANGNASTGNVVGVGTINVAVIVDKPLDKTGLLDLYRVVSEVKGMAIALAGPMCISAPSIGTASDATMVAAPYGNERFAGIATKVGAAAAKALLQALAKHIIASNYIDYVAKSLGFKSIDEIVEIAKKVYDLAPIPNLSGVDVEKMIREELVDALRDPNIGIVIRGARLAEALLALGLFPGISINEYRSDSPGIIADEAIGKAIAEYVNGFKGLLAYYWVERLKERGLIDEIKLLPPMTDDIVGAIVGGVLSKIYDRYSRK